MVYLKYLEGEVHTATCTTALLLPKEDVFVLTVVYGSVNIRAPGDVGAGSDIAMMKEASHCLLEPHIHQFNRFW